MGDVGGIVEWFTVINAFDQIRMRDKTKTDGNRVCFSGRHELFAFFGGDTCVYDDFGVLDERAV